jgi:metal-dependent amidase/aminoacylase/carboxypeptidase family protein
VVVIPDERVISAVEAQHSKGLEAMRFVHAHPELAHEEFECSAFVAQQLASGGFEVEEDVGGMPTAFRAVLSGGAPGRTVGVVCLYDAVAAVRASGEIEAVHSCGHGVIAGGVVTAALAIAENRRLLSGRLIVLGLPADEIHAPGTVRRGGGKAISAAQDLWAGVDAALYAHPEFIDTVSLESRWMRREHIRVSGVRSLSGVPEPPLTAARAVLEANARDIMVEHITLDGDVEEATGLVLRASVLVFADSADELEQRSSALRSMVSDAVWDSDMTVEGIRPDEHVTSAVADAFRAAGREFVHDPPPLPFATDFGNVSRRVPSALIGVGRAGGWLFHTDEGAEEFASAAGEESAAVLARVIALAIARLTEA